MVYGQRMRFDDDSFVAVLRHLEDRLRAPLPGGAAQSAMAPWPGRDWPSGFDHAHIRPAAGLLMLFPIADRPHVILTIRADTLGRHGGQVSLPGGVIDAGETVEEAALREAHEEIGLDATAVRVIGALTPLDIPISGFRLHPVVAATDRRPLLTAAAGEVAGILDVAVEELLDPARLVSIERTRGNQTVQAPAYQVAGVEIWGATAMVLAEFLALLK